MKPYMYVVDRCQSNLGRNKRKGMWFWFKQPLVEEGALCDKPKQRLQRRLMHTQQSIVLYTLYIHVTCNKSTLSPDED